MSPYQAMRTFTDYLGPRASTCHLLPSDAAASIAFLMTLITALTVFLMTPITASTVFLMTPIRMVMAVLGKKMLTKSIALMTELMAVVAVKGFMISPFRVTATLEDVDGHGVST